VGSGCYHARQPGAKKCPTLAVIGPKAGAKRMIAAAIIQRKQ